MMTTPEMTREEMLRALAGASEQDPIWRTVGAIIEEQCQIELAALLVPGLSNEAAQYNRGRVAALENLRDTLGQAWEASRIEGV